MIYTRLNEFDNLINYWITGKNDRQTSEPIMYMGSYN